MPAINMKNIPLVDRFKLRRWMAGACLAAIALAAWPAGAQQAASGVFPEELFSSIQRDMICLCGCKSLLKECPHVNCDYAIPARKRIREMLIEGKTRDQILAEFVRERGEQALAAPKREGFNLLGYILPFVAILTAGYGVSVLAKRWAGRGAAATPSQGAGPAQSSPPVRENDEMTERLKKEMEELDS